MVDSPMSASFTSAGILNIDDQRIKSIRPLIPPQILVEDFPLTLAACETVINGRKGAEAIIKGDDDRLLVIVGPCSVHDVKAALEYCDLLKVYAAEARQDLHILMRVYFEKPRTTVGWKGLINDPQLNGSFQINKGLRLARGLLLEIASSGLPTAVEFLDTISPQYIADLVSWGAIGARTTESQVHRELASGLSTPIGFKNGTDGSVDIAVDAIRASREGHVFLSVSKQGLSAIVETNGNPYSHIILRGANFGPNYEKEHVASTAAKLAKAGLPQRIMIDCSHGNSKKQHPRQIIVAEDIVAQLSSPETAQNILGVMIESNLVEGKQNIPAEGPTGLKYGQSVTDACLNWQDTVKVLDNLRRGVNIRRQLRQTNGHTQDPEALLAKHRPQEQDFNDLSQLNRS
ncbi:uncharacterized protein L969DRAFT_86787 [Mixia osmundae IAM 14324]|uniref:Phospho-2-dehydro-3-deoxyheptonate aldolase n=1 Tax=Mixia osmundae (strain CBS 9802 / IAM 14324 / JCM 22182 / KY 12970) TaxID=764103 RepID=G7E8Q7_MIXOS|nr:uncharacterized protein L969DRAFT_86787 [Mixia osmundae IAM 14324]KEI40161.1 hypothetical protein L969DRAFT_86787 [Mixia osmundae IAM 14324]GAA99525.1 hypothetical protein E5Q_06226 [Mixia osmundae IAM 14324]